MPNPIPLSPLVEYKHLQSEKLKAQAKLSELHLSRRRKEVAAVHPITMGKVYAPHWFTCETPPFHWEITDYAMKLNRFVVAAPVGSGKTVLLTKLLPLWSVLFEDVNEILLISNSNEMASGWLDEIRIMIESSREFQQDFGNIQGTHWGSSDLEFIIPGPARARRCVIKARGKGCAIRGLHPDRIILDDPQDEDSLKTAKVMDDFDDWFRGALLTRLDTVHKKLTYVGTAINENAYVVKLVSEPPQGWVAKAYSILNEEGHSIWPQKYSDDELARRRSEMGEHRFMADFMNAPLRNMRGKRFDLSKVKTERLIWNTEKSFGSLCLDPSFSVGGDQFAFTLVEQTHEGIWKVHEAIGQNTGTPDMLRTLWELWDRYEDKIDVIGIEMGGGAGDSLLYLINEEERRRKVSLPISILKHGRQKSKDDRIELLAPLIETGRIVLAPGTSDLRYEMVEWRTGRSHAKDNLLDSLCMHLEVQKPARPVRIPQRTRDDFVRERYRSIKDVMKKLTHKRPLSRWERMEAHG